MLTPAQTAIIKQTVPVLQAHGESLTRHFYARMFKHNPEVKTYFNPAHQRSGTQQRALAGAILAYAQHIDNPVVLGQAIEVIAQKHTSLTIQPEHYPIVGENLLASIREVLGDAATDDVIDAWAAAYGQLADVFIQREKDIYAGQDERYGWSGFKPFVVARRQVESDNIVSIYFEPVDGQPLAEHQPGQYVSIRLHTADGRLSMRNYSLSNAPGEAAFRISVKREAGEGEDVPAGNASNWIHDFLAVGDRVELSPPCGEFTLQLPEAEAQPLVLIAGGVGVTPLISMAHAALKKSTARPIIFVQASRHGGVRPFGPELEALAAEHANFRLHLCFDEPRAEDTDFDKRGLIEAEDLKAWVGDRQATYYFCGPMVMMQQVDQLLAAQGVPAENRRYECFGPQQPLAT
ncbi:NO-inducible flavohemoprotein [Salinicola sp. V024]|uniref:NO-inducible flavohemoprotein n=1 Tax=Salinicola TaxID=404432 RepID=UPI00094EF9E7|nr:NO-inducible flavohemoprotein [Salinicola sp. MH3R3-1]OLO08634.1 nitric oxide dioxygenase [Salinicola sp. MH3R3-1]